MFDQDRPAWRIKENKLAFNANDKWQWSDKYGINWINDEVLYIP